MVGADFSPGKNHPCARAKAGDIVGEVLRAAGKIGQINGLAGLDGRDDVVHQVGADGASR